MENNARYEMSEDERINRLIQIIDDKKTYLLQKYHTTYKATKQNEFLEGVLGDYEKYRQVIIAQKKQQIKALQTINHHIQSVHKTAEYGKTTEENSKLEQQRILNEIDAIKQDIDQIIGEISTFSKVGDKPPFPKFV
jgi:hypothetical protein